MSHYPTNHGGSFGNMTTISNRPIAGTPGLTLGWQSDILVRASLGRVVDPVNRMFRSLCCALMMSWGCSCAIAGEAPETNATATVVAKLVEQLVSPIGPPP